MHHCCAYAFAPRPECGHDEVVKSSDDAACEKGFGSLASVFSADEHLCGGCCFRERIFAVHFLYEIFAERYEEEYAEYASEETGEKYLAEIDRELRIFVLQDVKCWQCEYCSGHYGSGTGTDALDDDVFAEAVLASEG